MIALYIIGGYVACCVLVRITIMILSGVHDDRDLISGNAQPLGWAITLFPPFALLAIVIYFIELIKNNVRFTSFKKFDKFFWQLGWKIGKNS